MKKSHQRERAMTVSKAAFVGGLALLPLFGTAHAAGLFADPTKSTCTTPNCSAAVLDKAVILSEQVEASGVAATTPWDGQFHSAGGECVRVEVLSVEPAGRDLIMHLVGPDLTSWRDDDSGAGLLPRIEANTVVPGRYTVVVGLYAPTVTNTNTRFKLSYGRYPLGNPNCSEATSPLAASASALSDSEDKSQK